MEGEAVSARDRAAPDTPFRANQVILACIWLVDDCNFPCNPGEHLWRPRARGDSGGTNILLTYMYSGEFHRCPPCFRPTHAFSSVEALLRAWQAR
jgi:hypothetical protein